MPDEILQGVPNAGYVKPSKIQEWTLPLAKQGHSIIGQAQNGSGKTAAFALSMLMQIETQYQCPQALCICPTRELAIQNRDVAKLLGKFTKNEYFLAVPQEKLPREVKAQIVVGT